MLPRLCMVVGLLAALHVFNSVIPSKVLHAPDAFVGSTPRAGHNSGVFRTQLFAEDQKKFSARDRGTPEYEAHMAEKRKQKEKSWETYTGRNPDGTFGSRQSADDPKYQANPYDLVDSLTPKWQKEAAEAQSKSEPSPESGTKYTAKDRGTPEYEAHMAQKQKEKDKSWETYTGRNPDGIFGAPEAAEAPQYKANPYDFFDSLFSMWKQEAEEVVGNHGHDPSPDSPKDENVITGFFKKLFNLK